MDIIERMTSVDASVCLAVEAVPDRTFPHLTLLEPVAERAREYAAAARSDATRRAYATQWRAFESWCDGCGVPSLPASPAAVVLYLTTRADAGAKVATMALALSAISQAHVQAGHPSPRTSPLVRDVWTGIRNRKGAPQRQAAPVTVEQLRKLVRTGKGLGAARDRALLLLGFAGALRRSELVALDVADVREDDDGLVMTVRRSKTDQQGHGREIAVPFGSDPATCPVRALRGWLAASGIKGGALFVGVRYGRLTASRLDGGSVARVLKRAAKRAGVPFELLSGHSLRSGLVTAAAKAGKSIASIQGTTGHRSVAMVVKYVRSGTLFDDCAAAGIGL